jgi:hypothetical protein
MKSINSEHGAYLGGEMGFGAVLDRPAEKVEPAAGSALAQSLATLAVEFDWRVLWAIEVTTIVAIVVMGLLMTYVRDWEHFLAIGMFLAYFTTAGILGGYLISIKKKFEGATE